jgi:hypothetical protein
MVFERLPRCVRPVDPHNQRIRAASKERPVFFAATLASCLVCYLIGRLSRPRPRRRPADPALTDHGPGLAATSSNDVAEANAVLALLRQDIIELPSVIFAPRAATLGSYRR